MNWHDHIEATPGVIGGKPRVKGTRLGVVFLLELFGAGWTAEQVLGNYPHLSPEALKAVFAYAAETTDKVRLLTVQRDAA